MIPDGCELPALNAVLNLAQVVAITYLARITPNGRHGRTTAKEK